MREIGRIQLLQIQTDHLKRGEGIRRTYDLSALSVVETLLVTADGVFGLDGDSMIMDVHHPQHSKSRYRKANAVSINFANHYARMGDHFKTNREPGCAGENIIIDSSEQLDDTILESTLVLEGADGRHGKLTSIRVAAPCEPFTRYMLGGDDSMPESRLKSSLQFLDNGMRGYVCQFEGEPIKLRAGDRVYIEEAGQ